MASYGGSEYAGAFEDPQDQVSLALRVLELVIFSGVLAAAWPIRKRSAMAKRLLGIPFCASLVLLTISNIMDLVTFIMNRCYAMSDKDYYIVNIVIVTLYYLSLWLMLFVVVFTLNMLLREHLGVATAKIRAGLLVLLGVVALVTVAQVAMTNYNTWTYAGYNASPLGDADEAMRVAYSVVFTCCVLISGGFSAKTVLAMRSRRHLGGDLFGWVFALIATMTIWSTLSIVFATAFLVDRHRYYSGILTFEVSTALSYLQLFFRALSYAVLLCIARHRAWSKADVVDAMAVPYVPVAQDQHIYSYHGAADQRAYHNEAPIYVGAKP